jgi:CHAT domain-containing protein/Tfp pilus assembly protein PilF
MIEPFRRRGAAAVLLAGALLAFLAGRICIAQASVGPGEKTAPAGQPEALPALEPGKPVEETLAGGATRAYRVDLAAGQFVRFVVEQFGIDVVVKLLDPVGKRVAEVDDHSDGPERLSEVTEQTGSYRLEVTSGDKDASPGRYRLRIEELRPARDTDSVRVRAERGHDESGRLRAEGSEESRRKQMDILLKILPLWQQVGDLTEQVMVLTDLGEAYDDLGEKRQALEEYDLALDLARRGGDRLGEARVHNDLALVYDRIGEYRKAIEHYKASAEIFRSLGLTRDAERMSQSIGWTYRNIGMLHEALEIFQSGLSQFHERGDRDSEATVCNNIGLVYDDLGEPRKALEYEMRALPLRRAVGDRRGEAATLSNIAFAYSHLGECEKALDYDAQSLQLCRVVGEPYGEAYVLTNMGVLYLEAGNVARALDSFEEALPIRRAVGDLEGEALTLRGLARVERRSGNLTEARKDLESALFNYEVLRGNVLSPDQRSSMLTWVRPSYDAYIDLLMELHLRNPAGGFDALALAASEKARARSLLEMLVEARVDVRHGVDPDLLARERSLQDQLRAKVEEQMTGSAVSNTGEAEASRQKAVASLTTEIGQVEEEIRAKSPEFASLTQPRPLVLSEVQKELDGDTVLFEYALGEERSFLWAVSQSGMMSYELPKRAVIEEAARSVYRRVSARPKGPADLERYRSDAARLTQMLLEPAAELLRKRRVVIVADGALQFVPFEALPLPPVEGARGFVPLVADHEVVSLPSVSTLSVLRQDLAGRRPAPKLVAVIADPVFDGEDVRVRGSRPSAGLATRRREDEGQEADLVRSAREVGFANSVGSLPRLPFTRREAKAILSLVPAGDGKEALDFDASRATATSPELSQYRFVHFATHGLINTVHPELSGLVLSLVDRQARDQDGFLPSFEIFNLKLPADLVVLSACRTALGTEIRGEGLVGLTRAFLYAGSARVVASLWTVDDLATSELMVRFYGGMLGKDRLPPAAALRAAQIAMWKEGRWEHPYFWGAFTLQGEWN